MVNIQYVIGVEQLLCSRGDAPTAAAVVSSRALRRITPPWRHPDGFSCHACPAAPPRTATKDSPLRVPLRAFRGLKPNPPFSAVPTSKPSI